MKRVLVYAGVVLTLVVAICAGVIWYVRPQQQLNLQYREVNPFDKALQMVLAKQFAVTLSEDDLNNLLKKALREQPDPDPRVHIDGADFRLNGKELTAQVNGTYRSPFPVKFGATLHFRLEWQAPDIVATCEGGEVRGRKLPASWFQAANTRVNVAQMLPQPLKVRGVAFTGNGLVIQLKL